MKYSFWPEGQPVLAADEAEAVAEFEEERLQAGDQPVFEFALLHLPADAEEFEVVGALEHLVGLLGQILRQGEREVVGLLLRHRPFVGAGLDLVEQDIARPAEAGGGAEVVEAGGGVGELCQELAGDGPRELLRPSCLQKLSMTVHSAIWHSLCQIRPRFAASQFSHSLCEKLRGRYRSR